LENIVSVHSTAIGDDEKLVVSPRRAADMLDIGITQIYALIGAGTLESYKDGKSRKITTRSIRARIERKLTEPEPEISPMAKATAASLKRRGHSDEAAEPAALSAASPGHP
jgi:hypothetical protein